MKVKKIVKIVGITVVILIIFLLIHTIRNYIIITDLQNKIIRYSSSSNYYTKTKSVAPGNKVTMEYYKKDNKKVVMMERDLNGEIMKLSMYDNGEGVDTFTETKDSKVAQLNSGGLIGIEIYNTLETENSWQTFLSSVFANVKSTNYNGKEYYIIKGFLSSTSLTSEGAESYIEKETGLLIKTIEGDITMEKEYEFDNVEDSIFIKPDMSQYILKENS